MSRSIVEVKVTLMLEPVVMKVEIDTRDFDGEVNAQRVKVAAMEIAHDRYKHSEELPSIRNTYTRIK